MVERSLGPVEISALRVGRTDVGAASAVLDEDVLTLVISAEGEDRPLRLRLASIDSAHGGEELELVLRDGTRITLKAPKDFREAILDRCRSLPELTRTLRAFGSSRARRSLKGRDTEAGEQLRFFTPLLEARRAAGSTHSAESMSAFDGASLARALEETLRQFATDRHAQPGPARRALEAELVDASEPLFDALRSLAEASSAASGAAGDLRLWREWSRRLRTTFEVADRVWMAVDEVLDAAHRVARPVR